MNPNPLDQLRDVHLPSEPSFWPPAPGYIWLACVIFFLALGAFYWWWRGKKSRAMRKTIAEELCRIEKEYLAEKNTAQLQNQLNALLFRVFITKYPLEKRANIELAKIIEDLFKETAQNRIFYEQLVMSRFEKNPAIDAHSLMTLAKEQFKKCRV